MLIYWSDIRIFALNLPDNDLCEDVNLEKQAVI